MTPSRRPASSAFAMAMLLLGSLGVAAAWVLVAMALDAQSSWMALVAAADAALIVRLTRLRPGVSRAVLGVLSTLLAILVANWGIVAAWLGAHMGLLPWESMLKLGSGFALLLARLSNSTADLAWIAAALVAAAIASR
ncbi:hypothetical protein FZO89_18115 [Luteimonas viscosa]|uniref:Uncharacterized protein n=1 Tax=Luteimonas viscosa TaxID=1132694 RepID=A0A5D4XFY7_9GAMM|nr:hypothetical protein [Luteimonas viscosa]TYT23154.1 hypothetical protein FZO89_18115 [Luteimonas viscosa]